MNSTEKLFDINKVLKNIFILLKPLSKEKNIELIYEMGISIPRELRGDNSTLEKLFSTILIFVFQNTNQKEILLSLEAPEDFLYEESISFKITNTNIPKEKILAFLETGLDNNIELLSGQIIYDKEVDLHIDIPFTIGELGFRRHYRLPSKSMLDKKILLIVESENATKNIGKMFKYFPYDVDVGFEKFKEDKVNFSKYDLVVIEDRLITESFSYKISKIQEEKNLKYVILGNEDINIDHNIARISTHLVRPVTQESIFELIISLFEYDEIRKNKKINNPILDLKIKTPQSLQHRVKNSDVHTMTKKKKQLLVLNTRIGLENAKKNGLLYSSELENFLETFNKSDLYFRQIVNEKQTNKIKDFCIDLEKQAKIIGAESMLKFSDTVSLIFVYDKLDMLPIYPGRYHIELRKLVAEIKKYLHIQ